MGAMGSKLRSARGQGTVYLMHWCPGCEEPHEIRISGPAPNWSFNGDYKAPAFEPSVRVFVTHTTDDDDLPLARPFEETLCHYFIRRGAALAERGANLDPNKSYIDFCGDSPHKLRGKIVELPDWPYAKGEFGGIED